MFGVRVLKLTMNNEYITTKEEKCTFQSKRTNTNFTLVKKLN